MDEFGRGLEEQLQQQIIHEFWISRDRYLNEEYNSETSHLDGEELPRGIQIIYEYGPRYSVERYLPVWHYDHTVQLLDDGYEALLDYVQSGDETEIIADGGTHQIDTPESKEVWFWYDPSIDMVLQEEIEPYQVVGLFETRDAADRFLEYYADQYSLEDTSHLELYRAELEYVGNGPVLDQNPDTGEEEDLSEQAGLEQFHE